MGDCAGLVSRAGGRCHLSSGGPGSVELEGCASARDAGGFWRGGGLTSGLGVATSGPDGQDVGTPALMRG
jgi:hypothetical protein